MEMVDAETQYEKPKRATKPRKLPYPDLTLPEYRRLYQREYYRSNPRPKPPPKEKVKPTEEAIRQKNLEHAKRYYERNRDKIIAQIMEAQRRRKEAKRLEEI